MANAENTRPGRSSYFQSASAHRLTAVRNAARSTGSAAVIGALLVGGIASKQLNVAPGIFASPFAALAYQVEGSPNYTLSLEFTPARGIQQGLGFQGDTHYVGYDSGDGKLGRIVKYSGAGTWLSDSGLIGIGHVAELDWRDADGKLYVANGGKTSLTHVYKVDPVSGVIELDYNFEKLGKNGMVAIDNAADTMKVFYGPVAPDKNYRIREVSFDGTLGSMFVVNRGLGVPQGIEVLGDRILYLYSKPWGDGTKNHNNWINVYSLSGALLQTISLSTLFDESQGLSANPADNIVYVGAKGPNGVYKLLPAFDTAQTATQFDVKLAPRK
jgi:hypothetical protein